MKPQTRISPCYNLAAAAWNADGASVGCVLYGYGYGDSDELEWDFVLQTWNAISHSKFLPHMHARGVK